MLHINKGITPVKGMFIMEKTNFIKCEAKKCYYNVDGKRCSAEEVQIGSARSCCSSETECGTFVAKE